MAINLQNWESKNFNPYLWDTIYNTYGCGASLLATLLGENPTELYLKNKKNNPYWPEKLVINKIQRGGYDVLKLNDSITKISELVVDFNIKEYHILLTNQRMTKNETSWQLIWNNYIFHNMEIRPLKPLEFINNRLINVWVLKKKEKFSDIKY